MIPVISFYQHENYIFSMDYKILFCPTELAVEDFLSQIELEFANEMKIVQINFDATSNNTSSAKKCFYNGSKAAIFILKKYDILTIREIKLRYSNLLRQNKDFVNLTKFQLQMTKFEFLEKINAVKNMIASGRLYQMNLTAAFEANLDVSGLEFFLLMYEQFQGQYKSFLPLNTYSIISFSPELFLEKLGPKLITRPIKGSASILDNTTTTLINNEKEQAELSMIVDLLRNDLNSLEPEQAAVVTTHRQLMNLNYIHHTYSEIEIKTQKSLPHILQKMMPGGSISGCPKRESLLAIDELENSQRQAYTGTIGWWKNGDFTLNITIRTFVNSNKKYYYYAGCGIVYDSEPEKEFSELLNKAGKLNVQYK